MQNASDFQKQLRRLANPKKARLLQGFFKTGPGHYGEGDKFLGVTVPETRKAAMRFLHLGLKEIRKLLVSPFHEERLGGILILVQQYKKAPEPQRKKIYYFYMKNSARINNWDLVDSSAHFIAGSYLENKDRSPLYAMARSKNLWQRRIAIISTFHYIRRKQFQDTFRIVRHLLADKQDLIHKACGWMLREADKAKPGAIDSFLKRHYQNMPRTMLRYAIERFPEARRKAWLARP